MFKRVMQQSINILIHKYFGNNFEVPKNTKNENYILNSFNKIENLAHASSPDIRLFGLRSGLLEF